MKIGDSFLFKPKGKNSSPRKVTISYIGTFSVQVKDEMNRVYTIKKSTAKHKVHGPLKKKKKKRKKPDKVIVSEPGSTSVRTISTPTGGQPGYKKR